MSVHQNYTVETHADPRPRVTVFPQVYVVAERAAACSEQIRVVAAAMRCVAPAAAGAAAQLAKVAIEALLMAWDDAGILRRPVPLVSGGKVSYGVPHGSAPLRLR